MSTTMTTTDYDDYDGDYDFYPDVYDADEEHAFSCEAARL